MYGHIHIILKDLINVSFSAEKWAEILARSGFEEEQILESVQHPDEVSFQLLGATCQVTGLDLEEVLEAFGRHFIGFTLQSGYGRLFKALGNSFPSFVANVNYLHNHLERQHPHALFPYIEVVHEDGENSMELHYLSTRSGMKKIVVGTLTELGRQMFDLEVSMVEQQSPRYFQRDLVNSGHRAASWCVSWKPVEGVTSSSSSSSRQAKMSFPELHFAMMDLGKFLNSSFFDPFSCCRQQFQLRECISASPSEAERKFAEVQGLSLDRQEEILLRATPASSLAAAWTDDHMKTCKEFWSSSVGTSSNYALSHDADWVDVFVSHSWQPPVDWEQMMGPDVDYAEIKAATLAVMAKDVATAQRSLQEWGQITFWVDKACIAQDHAELKAMSIKLLDNFIAKCDSMCVLFTWTYLERLWCVYEWACVLVHKPTEKVHLQTELFVKEETLPLYLGAVRNFSLANTKCGFEEDRRVLEAKINEAYVSKDHFEVLVQATVIALMARSMAFRAGRSPKLYETYYQPWVTLARDLGMNELANALGSCDCLTWRRVSSISSSNCGAMRKTSSLSANSTTETKDIVSPSSDRSQVVTPECHYDLMQMSIGVNSLAFHEVISDWFEIDVVPILAKFQETSTK